MSTAATDLLDSATPWLARTSCEAGVLILVVLGLRGVLGRGLPPAWRICLWSLVGLKLLLPSFIPASFGIGDAAVAVQSQFFATLRAAPNEPVPETGNALDDSPRLPSGAESVPPAQPRVSQAPEPKKLVGWHSSRALMVLWLIGAVWVASRALVRQRAFERRLRRAPSCTDRDLLALVGRLARLAKVHRPVSVVLLPPGSTPAVAGVFRARLLMPEDWQARFDDRSLRHVILHELLHVRHGDLALNWAALVLQAVHWFNPLVWLAAARFQQDRELRCDAGALAILSPAERLEYGRTLLHIQQTFFAPPAIAGLAPCVRNHPALRHRIHMIARPTRNHPWLQALYACAFALITCYAFSTVRAAEEEKLPPKDRTREGGRGAATTEGEANSAKPGERDTSAKPTTEEGEGMRKSGAREGDGARKPGPREGEQPRTGSREGDGMRKTGARNGDQPKTGAREGDGARKPGPRDGEQPRTGSREGDGMRKTGARDGDQPKTGAREGDGARKPGPRDGEQPRTGAPEGDGMRKTGARDGEAAGKPGKSEGRESASGEVITLHVTKGGDAVMIGAEEIPANRLRGYLSRYLPQHPSAKVIVTGDPEVPYRALTETIDAVRDNGNKNVGIRSE